MKSVNVHEAKTHLSRLLEDVSRGEEIIIAKAGKPVAKLVPITTSRPLRTPGFLRGKIRIAEDFDDPLPDDVQRSFEGADE
jgi:prevent-host-death family protein